MRKWHMTMVSVLIAVGVAASSGYAQRRFTGTLDELLNLELSKANQEMAEEYLDILEDLQDILDDYGDYMEDSDQGHSDHQVPSVSVLRHSLKEGSYNDDPDRLVDDLYETVDEIKAVERQHRVKYDTNRPRCCRLPRSLRKELLIVAELVEDYADKQAVSVLGRADIKVYMDAALQYFETLKNHEALADLQADEIEELRQALQALGLAGKVRIDIDDLVPPELPEPPEVFVIPNVSPVPEVPAIVYRLNGHGRVGARHLSHGSIGVSRSSIPIMLENPMGDIIVTGAYTDEITATLSLEVTASSHAKEKKYLEQVTLGVGEDDDRYYVNVDLPRLSDHLTDLLTCELTVEVPASSRLECSNAFGRVTISGLEAEISVDGENSKIEISRITGDVDVENTQGPVSLDDIEGEIRVETSYAPIDITDCRGTIVVDNEYNSVTVLRTEGRLEIVNTGQIEVTDHSGNLEIENAYGLIEIDEVDGSVVIRNAYQPLLVADISGSADLENEYGEISAEGIGGSLIAVTGNGPIFAADLVGPIDLSNEYGNISVMLSPGFRGGSSISNAEGTVKVTFLEQPDLVLDIHTVGGSISSGLPISVRSYGDTKSAELVLGDGGKRLELIGSNTAIIIQGR